MATSTTNTASLTPWRDSTRWRPANLELEYDRVSDMLYLRALPVEPAGAVYLTEEQEACALITTKGELVGLQVENFRAGWLKKYPQHEPQYRDLVRFRLFGGRYTKMRVTPEIAQDVADDTGAFGLRLMHC